VLLVALDRQVAPEAETEFGDHLAGWRGGAAGVLASLDQQVAGLGVDFDTRLRVAGLKHPVNPGGQPIRTSMYLWFDHFRFHIWLALPTVQLDL
jgi:hypothetical protein